MSFLKKLFGGSGAAQGAARAEEYSGYRIYPEPVKADGGYRIAARIEKDDGGETRTHHLVRADILGDRDEAVEAAIRKAQQMIDQMGERVFD